MVSEANGKKGDLSIEEAGGSWRSLSLGFGEEPATYTRARQLLELPAAQHLSEVRLNVRPPGALAEPQIAEAIAPLHATLVDKLTMKGARLRP